MALQLSFIGFDNRFHIFLLLGLNWRVVWFGKVLIKLAEIDASSDRLKQYHFLFSHYIEALHSFDHRGHF